ncbi:glycosyltransferase family 2 protein [Caballeronia sp. GACF4]|uniref:glycosyltransferase family 2 protein n=1 Tax=Caballeronia sp. GACF4 TaxID=2921763 RepID=UPI0020288766|nr:glycosyltransferase family 2 protein [Caballeronia sp. GACF4]
MKEKFKRIATSRAVRATLQRLPTRSRHALRRALKATYWMATPHLLPQRLKFLRMRRQLGGVAAVNVTAASVSITPSYFSFAPQKTRSSTGVWAPVHEAGRYSLDTDWKQYRYAYLPPRRPDDIARRIAALKSRPFFSIVTPAYNTPVDLLQKLLASVEAQWYGDYELIIVDDHSPSETAREALHAAAGNRVKVLRLERNAGISEATNAGIREARGDYVVFLDHDDELTPDCLWELAIAANATDADFIYSDEDKILSTGEFSEPFFKPDWSPDTVMSTMFTCHVSAAKRALVIELGGLRSEYDGAQDWDFVLRIAERTPRIAHIPKVLYHWRVIPGSVAADLAEKPYAVDASVRAREAALERRGLKGVVEPLPFLPGHARVKYEVSGSPLVSIVIPSRDNGTVLTRCVESIFARTTWREFEIIVMDNGSRRPQTLAQLDALAAMERVTVVRHDFPFNYSEINNVGARRARGEFLLFLNDDTEVISPDWMERMLGYAQLPHVGAVGAKLIFPGTRSMQHCGIVNLAAGPGHAFFAADADTPVAFARNMLEYDWIAITGACLLIQRSKFDVVGGFDETFPIAYNDVDLGFALVDAGFYNVLCPSVELIHHESLTRGDDSLDPEKLARLVRERQRLYAKHPRFYMRDPFHNPNLSPSDVQFRIPAG